MLCPTEVVYLAAPYHTPQQQAFNQRVARLVRAYNFPLFMPEEAEAALLNTGTIADWQPSGELANVVCNASTFLVLTDACRMEMIRRANLVLAVCYGHKFNGVTAFEVGYALGRRINVVAIQNNLPETSLSTESSSGNGAKKADQKAETILASPGVCHARVIAPERDDQFPDRLIPVLNRYFEAHKL
jgi:nucleoside 2-deoxyribosyltransferase